eukprot:TRINITY_DN33342_c0_g1_i1.p1 TRINITY_DN33342_c0_g1~~TRINITY_DN33342_c0_g1_i1.p1  ORF type:complete len:987 (-),score=197.07 TRINITY_DN33342_c0_g1_i1:30-2933(-)
MVAEKENELTRALARRRATVEKRGSHFSSEATQSVSDVRHDDVDEKQFTPRSSHRRERNEEIPHEPGTDTVAAASPEDATSVVEVPAADPTPSTSPPETSPEASEEDKAATEKEAQAARKKASASRRSEVSKRIARDLAAAKERAAKEEALQMAEAEAAREAAELAAKGPAAAAVFDAPKMMADVIHRPLPATPEAWNAPSSTSTGITATTAPVPSVVDCSPPKVTEPQAVAVAPAPVAPVRATFDDFVRAPVFAPAPARDTVGSVSHPAPSAGGTTAAMAAAAATAANKAAAAAAASRDVGTCVAVFGDSVSSPACSKPGSVVQRRGDDSEGCLPSKGNDTAGHVPPVASSRPLPPQSPVVDGRQLGDDAARQTSRLVRSGFVAESNAGVNGGEHKATPCQQKPEQEIVILTLENTQASQEPAAPLPTPLPSMGITRMCSSPVGLHGSTNSFLGSALTARSTGDSVMWKAVVEGDLRKVEELALQGSLNSARVLDQNGHSVFWNAVAFQHMEVALWLLKRFPPGTQAGVDLGEVHARRGDSLLHLSLYPQQFEETAAEVFRTIFVGVQGYSQADRELKNQSGQTFVHVAANRLNFWVLRLVLSQAPELSTLFQQRDSQGHTPLEYIKRRAGEVVGASLLSPPPAPEPLQAFLPPWAAQLAKYAPTASSGLSPGDEEPPPFADLVVEVEDTRAKGGVAKLPAHRIVVGSCSGALHGLMRKLPSGAPVRLDPICCRSAEVAAAVLRFMYGGDFACSFAEDGFLMWQLLCLCTRYMFPEALTRFARTGLLHLIGEPRHATVLPALVQAADKVGLSPSEGIFAACTLLQSQEALDSTDGKQAKVLLATLREIERGMLDGSRSGGGARPDTSRTSAPAQAAAGGAKQAVQTPRPAPSPLSVTPLHKLQQQQQQTHLHHGQQLDQMRRASVSHTPLPVSRMVSAPSQPALGQNSQLQQRGLSRMYSTAAVFT